MRQCALGRVHRPETLHVRQHPPDGQLDLAERRLVAQVDRRMAGQLARVQASPQLVDPGGQVLGGHAGILAVGTPREPCDGPSGDLAPKTQPP